MIQNEWIFNIKGSYAYESNKNYEGKLIHKGCNKDDKNQLYWVTLVEKSDILICMNCFKCVPDELKIVARFYYNYPAWVSKEYILPKIHPDNNPSHQ